MIFAATPGRLAPKRRLSWRVDARLLVLINAQMFSCPLIISRFFRLSTAWDGFLLVTVLLSGITVDAALKQFVAVKLQQLAARGLVKGNHPPPGIHPNPPHLALLFLFLGQSGILLSSVVFLPFYAIFV